MSYGRTRSPNTGSVLPESFCEHVATSPGRQRRHTVPKLTDRNRAEVERVHVLRVEPCDDVRVGIRPHRFTDDVGVEEGSLGEVHRLVRRTVPTVEDRVFAVGQWILRPDLREHRTESDTVARLDGLCENRPHLGFDTAVVLRGTHPYSPVKLHR